MQRVDLPSDELKLGPAGRRLAWISGLIGVGALGAAGLLASLTEHGAERFYRAYLLNYSYFLSLALGALFFVLVTHLTRAGWSVALRRLAEGFAWTLYPLALLAVVIVFGIHHLYEWSHAEAVAGDPLLQGKAPYLNTPFFVGRLVFYFAIWCSIASYFLRRSTEQDGSGKARDTLRMEVRAAPAMIALALTLTFASFDLLMSLYPHWYSTIWGVYYFSGAVVGFFSLLALCMYGLQRSGRLVRSLTGEHYHDVGKLMFAFVVFWAYIAFSQYMLIWYGNIPEETGWYVERQTGQWTWVSLALLFGHFVLPFLFLVSRHPKRRRGVLALAASWLLLMHWLDLYWIVMPQISPGKATFALVDLACFVGIGGVFVAAAAWRMGRYPLLPVRDPRLNESLQFENV